ncbi:MAG: hypothetical protein K0U98_00895 [Deltaproteobacteria bacterium]|nr:hypothetical protein [Deltaproteobacteria bacterium]
MNITVVTLALIAATQPSDLLLEQPSPITVKSTLVVPNGDGTVSSTTTEGTTQTLVERVVVAPGYVDCAIWEVTQDSARSVTGLEACQFLFKDKWDEFLRGAEAIRSLPLSMGGGGWSCRSDSLNRIEDDLACEVTITEYDDGAPQVTERIFGFDEVAGFACNSWCMTHWQEDGHLVDLLYTCTGDHEGAGSHEAYDEPSGN